MAGGQPTDLRAHHVHAAAAQRLQMALRGRVFEHLGVHGRADDDRSPRRHGGKANHVLGQAQGHPGDGGGGSRSDDQGVSAAGQLDV